jgi:hypothetical protein
VLVFGMGIVYLLRLIRTGPVPLPLPLPSEA